MELEFKHYMAILAALVILGLFAWYKLQKKQDREKLLADDPKRSNFTQMQESSSIDHMALYKSQPKRDGYQLDKVVNREAGTEKTKFSSAGNAGIGAGLAASAVELSMADAIDELEDMVEAAADLTGSDTLREISDTLEILEDDDDEPAGDLNYALPAEPWEMPEEPSSFDDSPSNFEEDSSSDWE